MAIFNVMFYHVIHKESNRVEVLQDYNTMFLFAWNSIHQVIFNIMYYHISKIGTRVEEASGYYMSSSRPFSNLLIKLRTTS